MNAKLLRNVVCAVLVALYFIGMCLLILGSVRAGITLWSISTIGGLGVLWYIKSREKEDTSEREEN